MWYVIHIIRFTDPYECWCCWCLTIHFLFPLVYSTSHIPDTGHCTLFTDSETVYLACPTFYDIASTSRAGKQQNRGDIFNIIFFCLTWEFFPVLTGLVINISGKDSLYNAIATNSWFFIVIKNWMLLEQHRECRTSSFPSRAVTCAVVYTFMVVDMVIPALLDTVRFLFLLLG